MSPRRCRHSSSISMELCCFCNSSTPEKLIDLCFDYINRELESICEYTGYSGYLKLKNGISLPVQLCEKFLAMRSQGLYGVDSNFINIFKDTSSTTLKRVSIRKSNILDHDLEVLLSHQLLGLELAQSKKLTHNCIRHITTFGFSLTSLSIGENVNIFPVSLFGDTYELDQNLIFSTPNLHKFVLRGCQGLPGTFYELLLSPMKNLTHLDLSRCGSLGNFNYSDHLSCLRSLILYNIDNIDEMVPAICKLKRLTHLDVSQSRDEHRKFPNPTATITAFVQNLPHLTSLDISGTNLAGTGSVETDKVRGSDIPGLASRVNNPLHFLGLYETLHDACLRHNVPAELMLQSSCRHSSTIPSETCCFCNFSAPKKLLDLCFHYINKDLETICEITEWGDLKLKNGISLPVEICEKLLAVRSQSLCSLDTSFINIFKDTTNTRLKRVCLRKSKLLDHNLEVLLNHNLLELELAQCKELTHECIRHVTTHGASLVSVSIGENVNIFPVSIFGDLGKWTERNIFNTPNLRRLTLKSFQHLPEEFYGLLLNPMSNLTYLDLSNCGSLGDFSYSEHLVNLRSLILYNVDNIDEMVLAICKLKSLTHLDVSQSRDEHRIFPYPTANLTAFVNSLPHLTSLDISGTNLAGTGVAETDKARGSDIPGLISRVDNPFHFLGLYETLHDACLRHDIPAKLIAGNANEEQILTSALAYMDRTDLLQKVLNDLFHLFRYETCQFLGQALDVVLESMNRHLDERHIQISASATLFYIVKGTDLELHDAVHVKRKIISTILNGMSVHRNDETMMRNGCLTLCQFKIPLDVLFEYERLVDVLLYSVHGMTTENFVQRIGIYLLNSLACQVDGHQKVRLGELGAINKMIWLIAERLEKGYCDDVLEVAWSTMWNVTDETPSNCRKFLENNGMEYFLSCLHSFPNKEDLLRNMMGLLGNVAEVKELRHYLITPEYLSVFSDLLASKCDGIEVSYNAAGVISHIASDGPDVWTVEQPSRQDVLNKLVLAIDSWDINSPRNINYRSFEPILYLVKIFHTPECQRWAVWALANLTRVYPEKYCNLVEKEGGLELLKQIISHPDPPPAIKALANVVIENCKKYKNHDLQQELDG